MKGLGIPLVTSAAGRFAGGKDFWRRGGEATADEAVRGVAEAGEHFGAAGEHFGSAIGTESLCKHLR